MILEFVTTGLFETNAYLVGCEKTHIAGIIDPAPGSYELLEPFLKKHGLKLQGIYLTHSHIDHIADAHLFQQDGIPIYVHPLDKANLIDPGSDGIPNILDVVGATPTGFLQEGESFSIGEITFEILFTPGHSPGSVSFYSAKEDILFTGDLLFCSAHGRTDFPSSSAQALYRSLREVMKLPDSCRVFAGHGDDTTIGAEKKWVMRLCR
ncbi:MAG: MBL fold metallo-hydrolase [Verrucomicrobia bacterium]|nr:MBL fold metallo-hydrolase [Verrucomicrobiota bacterium]